MNNVKKISIVALLSIFLIGCDKTNNAETSSDNKQNIEVSVVEPKEEFKQLMELDQAFNPALETVQKEVMQAAANKDKAALNVASGKFFVLIEDTIKKYSNLNLQDTEVKGLRDKMVSVLQQTIDFTKKAQQIKSEEEKNALIMEKNSLITNAQALQTIQTKLAVKFGFLQDTSIDDKK
ncbi:hypothetical protein [Pasteurella atlantica]|uniref:Uncharacterized protein n=2 Tax=Pasteurellaceae TaxID=712 RepID=A0ACC6HN43_9PAST|nr:hypothetical protein [Pasteurella atlantica]MDP8052285.1 hypothetical protein [Pasteurella atlantica]MDP8098761.1 hypothetical protein [Pasteurella atlantica]MDP8101778.1 hypothetical protein [Pasteurella atlantica]MDP8105805.1 hypothetical protein [Pasteurella atlantica]MDP8106873.1 hypothetical protein [Pasteurella atlantica]